MTKPLWTSNDICAATHSSLCSKDTWSATGLSINSKEINPGDIFIAIKGEKVDGHAFLDDAFKNGAIAAIVENAPPSPHHYVVVRNTADALTDIGRMARNRLKGTVIGVTGSAGKTSTKDMIHLVLSSFGKTYATKRSFNSTLTVPLSLASCDPDVDYGVFEVGMNRPGEIESLAKIVRPHIGIVTNIAPAHLQNFDSVDDIAHEKSSLFLGIPSNGHAIIPGDSAYRKILESYSSKKGIKTYTFGKSTGCDARLIKNYEKEGRYYHDAIVLGKPCTFHFSVPGDHWAMNALTALLTSEILELDFEKAISALNTFTPSERRGVPTLLCDNRLLIDESYNANPLSMQVAIDSFGKRSIKGRKIAVLGDMKELGEQSETLHKNLKASLEQNGISILITCGDMMGHLHKEMKGSLECYHFENLETLIEKLFDILKPNDAMMVKASLSMGFIKIVQALHQKFSKE
jgi:UDP-N-acetylmuramoyl-tripeptide--D-alanyl-D-alanine ligase